MDDFRFDDQAVIVTGGCRGIGRGIAQRFADAGAPGPDVLPARARVAARRLAFVAADVREPDQIDAVIAECTAALRPARRADQQRGRVAARRLCDRVAAVHRGHHRA